MLGIVLGSPHTSPKISNGQEKGVGEAEVKNSRFFWSRILLVLSTHKKSLSALFFFLVMWPYVKGRRVKSEYWKEPPDKLNILFL